MNSAPKLSIVLPCYNESRNLPAIFARFREVLETRDNIEVVFVDNGSSDDSQAILERECGRQENEWATLAVVAVNQGYGFGIMSGIRQATGEVLSWTHADMQTDPADVLAAYDRFISERDPENCFLKGRRVGRNPLDVFFTLGMSVVSFLALGQWLSDINAQPKMFHRAFLEQMIEPPDDFSLDLYALHLARKLEMKILEHPVHFGKRKYGQAKGGGTLKGKIKLIKRSWKYILDLRGAFQEKGEGVR